MNLNEKSEKFGYRVTIENKPDFIFTPEQWKKLNGCDGFGKNGLPKKSEIIGIEFCKIDLKEFKDETA